MHRWFWSTTKYSPIMIYLQNRLINNSHCSNKYNKLLYMCGGGGYCELLVNFADFLFIVHAILLFQVHPDVGPPASLSLHMASSSITPAGYVLKSRGDSVVRMWVQLKRWCVSCITEGA